MPEEYTYHVADAVELMELMPQSAVVHFANMQTATLCEPVFMVCDQTNTIENGTMVDTRTSKYFTFEVIRVGDRIDLVPTSEWQPCKE